MLYVSDNPMTFLIQRVMRWHLYGQPSMQMQTEGGKTSAMQQKSSRIKASVPGVELGGASHWLCDLGIT